MARSPKTSRPAPEPVPPSDYATKLEALVDRLRAQVATVTTENEELKAAAKARARVEKPFVARKYPLNGFVISISGSGCMESDIRVDAVGDIITIYTGDSIDGAKREPFRPQVGVRSGAAASAQSEESWTNLGPGSLPIGLGPSPNLTPEQKLKAMETGSVGEYLNQVEGTIIESKGRFGGL